MKFQILSFQRLKDTIEVEDPFVAITIGVPWPINGDRFYGRTPEEARNKLIKAVQTYFDNEYTNLTVTEVELALRTVDRWGRTL